MNSGMLILGAAIGLLATSLHGNEPVQEVQLPELGDPASSIVTPEQERKLGQELLKQIRTSLPMASDPLLKYFVRLNLYQLATSSELSNVQLYPVLVASPELNAFAAPGGIVGVNLGLFRHAQDVHEYSAVIAHELAHLSQRHYARGQEARKGITLPSLVSLLGSAAIIASGNPDLGSATLIGSQALSQQSLLKYSRSHEAEADRIGFNTLVRAGFDPSGMERLFKRMGQMYMTSAPPQWLLTHPLTEDRVGDARRQADQIENKTYADSTDYQWMRARAMLWFAKTPDEAMERANQIQSTELAKTYATALALLRSPERDQGAQLLEELRKALPTNILLSASYGEALVIVDRQQEAVRFLKKELEFNPGNQPLGMVYANALRKAQDFNTAVQVLRKQCRDRPYDIDAWYALAETAGLAGDVPLVHQARAEFYVLRGENEKAVEHLRLASDLVDPESRKGITINQRMLELIE